MKNHTGFIKSLSLIFIFLAFNAFVFSQSKVWTLETAGSPSHAIVQFSNSPNWVSSPTVQGTYLSSIHGPDGNLLFYFAGTAYDKYGNAADGNGVLNPYTQNQVDRLSGYPELLIIPKPSECKKYYVIGAVQQTNVSNAPGRNPAPVYCEVEILDVPDPNSQSYVSVIGDQSLFPGNICAFKILNSPTSWDNYDVHTSSMQIAASKIRSASNDRLLFIFDSQQLYKSIISNSGISTAQVISNYAPAANSSTLISEMELWETTADVNYRYKLAIPVKLGTDASIDILKLDVNGDYIANSKVTITLAGGLQNVDPKGLEFSPDGNYLYVTRATSPYIECYNSSTGTLVSTSFSSASNFNNTMIETGADNNMYLLGTNTIGQISNTNTPSTLSWNPTFMTLPTGVTFSGASFSLTGTSRSIKTIPEQVDFEDYYSNTASLSPTCCQFTTVFDKDGDYTAPTGTQLWEGANNPLNSNSGSTAKIKGRLTIPANADVEIRDMTIEFGQQGSILIQPGGTLRLTGSTLTGNPNCQTMWYGVQVLGTGVTGSPNLSAQGRFYCNISPITGAHSKIEQAQMAVGCPGTNGGAAYFTTGGFFDIRNTDFTNNGISVQKYRRVTASTYQSNIQDCNFSSTTLWSPFTSSKATSFLELNSIQSADLWLHGNLTFNGAITGAKYVDVQDIPLSGATFTNCSYGIYSTRISSSSPTQHHFISNTFNDCFYGIFLNNTTGDRIELNNFNLSLDLQTKNYYGIYLDHSNDFHITDNNFYKLMYGIYVWESGVLGGRISSQYGGNIFDGCWRGIHCRGDNQNLTIKCNTFYNNQANSEFSVAWYIGGKLADQGQCIAGNWRTPAGNKFYHMNTGRIDLTYPMNALAGNPINYSHHQWPSCATCKPNVNNTSYIILNNCSEQMISSSCTSQSIMEMANGDPVIAQQLINEELDQTLKILYINELIKFFIDQGQDSTAIQYLIDLNMSTLNHLLVDLYVRSASYSEAQSLLSHYCASSDPEDIDYCALYGIMITWADEGRTPYQMTTGEEAVLRDVSSHTTAASSQARSIISLVFNETFTDDWPSDTGYYRISESGLGTNQVEYLLLTPNPASENLTLNYTFQSETQLTIFDAKGVKKRDVVIKPGNDSYYIETKDLENGVYLLHASQNNIGIFSERFVILH